jgi:UDP-2,4-diacetamido-2,4,6-trideoxy-beta-L-altropyranose hydrolase
VRKNANMGKVIAIQADGNESLGVGHLIRTSAIAEELESIDFDVLYFTHTPQFIEKYKIIQLRCSTGNVEESFEEVKSVLEKSPSISLLIIDSYCVTSAYLEKLNRIVPVMYIDDLGNIDQYNCAYLVNGNIYGKHLNYKGTARKLLGPKYCLLRQEFRNIDGSPIAKSIESIMVTFGGSDVKRSTLRILPWLEKYTEDKIIRVVIGPAFESEYISKLNEFDGKFELLCNPPSTKEIMAKSDIAISASGSTVYELLACGIPFINICTEENQQLIAREIRVRELALFSDQLEALDQLILQANLDMLISDFELRESLSQRGQQLLDGKGANRVTSEIEQFLRT